MGFQQTAYHQGCFAGSSFSRLKRIKESVEFHLILFAYEEKHSLYEDGDGQKEPGHF
jgi:hypothetical protein